MNLKHFLTHNNWWGKCIGAGLGFLTAGPAGALLGVLVGNLFDKGLSEHMSRPHIPYHETKRPNLKQAYQHALFSIMGHIAKADGRVSEREINLTNDIMYELKLNQKEREAAKNFFKLGKKNDFDIKASLMLYKSSAHGEMRLTLSLVQLCYRMALLDGLNPQKVRILNILLNTFNLAPLHQQAHAKQFYDNVYRQKHRHYQSSNEHQNRYQSQSFDPIMNEDAYRTLGVKPNASKPEVKKAYRKLMGQYHPDRQIAKGATQSEIKSANEKTQTIRKAYDYICKQHGW